MSLLYYIPEEDNGAITSRRMERDIPEFDREDEYWIGISENKKKEVYIRAIEKAVEEAESSRANGEPAYMARHFIDEIGLGAIQEPRYRITMSYFARQALSNRPHTSSDSFVLRNINTIALLNVAPHADKIKEALFPAIVDYLHGEVGDEALMYLLRLFLNAAELDDKNERVYEFSQLLWDRLNR
jgi:hypothetical protein